MMTYFIIHEVGANIGKFGLVVSIFNIIVLTFLKKRLNKSLEADYGTVHNGVKKHGK